MPVTTNGIKDAMEESVEEDKDDQVDGLRLFLCASCAMLLF